jgi:hypothetical protein
MILIPLMILAFLGLWIGLICFGGPKALRKMKSKTIAVIAGSAVLLLAYWQVFGDLIPTLSAHREYCEKEAGFKVYVTPEQWAAENPGVLEALKPYEKSKLLVHLTLGNDRFGIKYNISNVDDIALQKQVESVIDIKTKKILAENIDFSRGYGIFGSRDARAIKTWLYLHSCYSDQEMSENKRIRKEYFNKLNASWGT